MRKALDYFLSNYTIQKVVDLVEENIKSGYDENIIIHHKQNLSFLHSIRTFEIDNDETALIYFLGSKELSRSYRTLDRFCEDGNQEGVNLLQHEINFVSCLLVGETRYEDFKKPFHATEAYKTLHPERISAEANRNSLNIIPMRKADTIYR